MDITKLKDTIRTWASTNHLIGAAFGALFGIKGLIFKRRGSLEHLKSTVSLLNKSNSVLGRPINITIEPTNMCNLECPVCETGAGILGRKNEHMSLESFQLLMNKVGAHTNTLMFYFMGEPFLNKKAYEMIAYAKKIGIPFVDTCTNGDAINPKNLIESGIDRVSFQIGGMTQATHQIYRINSNLDRVLSKLRETIRLKQAYNSPIQVNCGFILMKHNEHEVDIFLKTMAEIGVNSANVIDPCVRTIEQGHAMLPSNKKHWIYDPKAFSQGQLKPKTYPNNTCPWIYYSLTIHVNGNVVPCCRDPKGEEVMGNLFFESLDEIWNGEKFKKFRAKIHEDQGSISICRLCTSYPASVLR